MEIRNLRTFLVVAEEGTISHASRRLNSVQSNITSRIKSLEAELGEKLFMRSRSGMALTAAGVLFRSHAQAVVDAEASAIAAIKNFSSSVKFLRIGSMESTLAVRLPKHISAFRSAHPNVKLKVYSGPSDDLVSQLLDNKVDIAFIGGQFHHPDIEGRIAFSEEMVLATEKNINDPKQAGTSPVIVFKQGCSYRDYAQSWMKNSGLSPNDVMELGTLDGILGCVASGVGVTLLPRSIVESSRHRNLVNIHSLNDGDRHIDTIAIRNTSAPANGAVDAFMDLVCRPNAAMEVPSPMFLISDGCIL